MVDQGERESEATPLTYEDYEKYRSQGLYSSPDEEEEAEEELDETPSQSGTKRRRASAVVPASIGKV